MKRLLLTTLMFLPSTQGFTVDDALQYAASLPENPAPIGPSYLINPDYSRWYQYHEPWLFTRLVNKVGIARPSWSPKIFSMLLAHVATARVKKGFAVPHTMSIKAKPGSQVIIIGPLYGAYHSFMESIGDLVRKKLLDYSFKLSKPDTYLVMLGDTIDGSPYNMETLTVIFELMNKNPENVFYVAGLQETKDTWHGGGLAQDILTRTRDQSLLNEMSTFFKTLPRALFIQVGKDTIKLGNDSSLKGCSAQGPKPRMCPSSEERELPVKVVIHPEHRSMSYQNHPGLLMTGVEEGAQAWAVFSGSNRLYREEFRFVYDAYAILTIGSSLDTSVISLYNQNVGHRSGFTHASRLLVLTGKELRGRDEKADFVYGKEEGNKPKQEPLYIGCTLDLTKGAAPIGRRVRDGIVLALKQINDEGGINGRPVSVIVMDDEYSPEKARRNVETFMKTYKSPIFLCNLGSPTLESYAELVKKGDLFLFFPITGAPDFRKKEFTGVVHWRASYSSEAQAVTQYVVDTFAIRSFGFLYQDDSYGVGALAGAQKVLDQKKITKVVKAPYERNVTSFSRQVKSIQDGLVSAIGFFSTSVAAMEFIRQAGVEFFMGKKLFAVSDLAEESFTKFVKQRGLDMTISQFAPNPHTSTMDIVEDFRKALSRLGITESDVFALEGYMSTSLMVNILKQAGPEYTKESINKVISSLENTSFKGLPLSFDPETRELVHLLWLDTGAPEWVLQKTSS
jgi:branched-chain amino acid transport system substrate-binding protein